MTYGNSHFTSSLYFFFLGLTIMFPVTFRISIYTSKMPKYVKNLKDGSVYKAMEDYRKIFNEPKNVN